MSEFDARLAALEARLADLRVEDLPLEPLKRKLTQSWLPNVGEDIITSTDVLGNLAYGRATLTFSANNDSVNLAVQHGLGREPTAIVATPYNVATVFVKLGVVGRDAQTITFKGRHESAVTTTVEFSWVAIA